MSLYSRPGGTRLNSLILPPLAHAMPRYPPCFFVILDLNLWGLDSIKTMFVVHPPPLAAPPPQFQTICALVSKTEHGVPSLPVVPLQTTRDGTQALGPLLRI